MTMFQTLLLFVGIAATTALVVEETKCQISINFFSSDLPEPQPLILTDTENPEFLLPKEKYLLIIPANTSILLACPGENNYFEHFEGKQVLKASCIKEKQFSIDSTIHPFKTFKCKRLPEDVVRKSNITCLRKHQRYEIGFEFEDQFLALYEVCRDENNYRTYYSKQIMVKEIGSMQLKYKRPEWKQSSFYPGIDINQLYTFIYQRQQVGSLLGSNKLANKYIYFDKNDRLNQWQSIQRGHLTPKSSFVYGAQQATTLWFLNANPQWGSFNSGNWLYLESSIRNLTAARYIDLIIYTGVHGITTLKDVNNNTKEIYLFVNDTEKLLPVPRFFWKIIHEPISNCATAFIGVNEPYADKITDDMYLCPDISDKYDFSWLNWKPHKITRGISYICTVESLRKVVSTIPRIGETGLFI